MAKPAIVLVQSFTYRDLPEEWSNKYHFAGPAPGDATAWAALANSLLNALRPCFSSQTVWHRAYGYNDGDQNSVWSWDWTNPGPPPGGSLITPGDGARISGDVAAMLKWNTNKRNSRGKVVYARKYMHGIFGSTGDPDKVSTGQKTALDAFATKCTDGTISSVFHLCLPDGTTASNGSCDTWLTTRTLKRRGKRPPT